MDYEAYREKLAVFCENDAMPERARRLRRGEPLRFEDERMIDAIIAAENTSLIQREAA